MKVRRRENERRIAANTHALGSESGTVDAFASVVAQHENAEACAGSRHACHRPSMCSNSNSSSLCKAAEFEEYVVPSVISGAVELYSGFVGKG